MTCSAAQAKFVVIDESADNRELAQAIGVRFIEGDAADDSVLRRAGIARARADHRGADSDASNIFITLTARELRSDIVIVARASVEDSEKKLKRAGADRVISPYKASGTEMARLALHPQVAGMFDVDSDYRMEEIVVSAGCDGESKTIGDIRGLADRRPASGRRGLRAAATGRDAPPGGRRPDGAGNPADARSPGGALPAGQGQTAPRLVNPLGQLHQTVLDAAGDSLRGRERARLRGRRGRPRGRVGAAAAGGVRRLLDERGAAPCAAAAQDSAGGGRPTRAGARQPVG